jgi:hypothetical protein
MNREELRSQLERAGVHPGNYSLDGLATESESFSLVADGPAWKILYKERGEFSELQTGLSESEACQFIYRIFDEAHGLGS